MVEGGGVGFGVGDFSLYVKSLVLYRVRSWSKAVRTG